VKLTGSYAKTKALQQSLFAI